MIQYISTLNNKRKLYKAIRYLLYERTTLGGKMFGKNRVREDNDTDTRRNETFIRNH
jgi:hypothetical protein